MMANANQRTPNQIVFVMQIITIALILGIATFMAMAFLITQGQQPEEPFLAYIGIAFAAIAVLATAFIRLPVNLNELRNENFDPRSEEVFLKLAPICQMELIIKLALLEGAAFFNGAAYISETHWWSLAVMAALAFVIAAKFPTATRISQWIERRTMDLRFAQND